MLTMMHQSRPRFVELVVINTGGPPYLSQQEKMTHLIRFSLFHKTVTFISYFFEKAIFWPAGTQYTQRYA